MYKRTLKHKIFSTIILASGLLLSIIFHHFNVTPVIKIGIPLLFILWVWFRI